MKSIKLLSFEFTPTNEGFKADMLVCIRIGSASSVFFRSKLSIDITGVAYVIIESMLLNLDSCLLNTGELSFGFIYNGD